MKSRHIPILASLLLLACGEQGVAAAAGKSDRATAAERVIPDLQSEDLRTRFFAIGKLGEIGDKSAVEPLIAVLNDTTYDPPPHGQGIKGSIDYYHLRIRAMAALVKIGDKRALPHIEAVAKNSPKAIVRREAAHELRKMGDPDAEDVLLELMKDEEAHVRSAALNALVKLESTKVPGLLVVELKRPDGLHEQALREIGRLKPAGATEAIIPLLQAEDRNERLSAIAALGRLADPVATMPLTKLLNHENDWVRRRTAQALAKIGDRRAIGPLVTRLNDTKALVAMDAAKALVAIGKESMPHFLAQLDDKDAGARARACISLGDLRDPAAGDKLILALKDDEYRVRSHAAEALGKIRYAKAGDALIALLKDETDFVRHRAAQALCLVGVSSTEDAVIAAVLAEPDYGTCIQMARGFTNATFKTASSKLVAALRDHSNSVEVRANAAIALGFFDEDAASKALLAELTTKPCDTSVRIMIWMSLCRSDDANTLERLMDDIVPALEPWTDLENREQFRLWYAAIGMVGKKSKKLNTDRAVQPLINTLRKHGQKGVPNEYAQMALQRITGENFEMDADRWQAWRDKD